MTTDSTVLNKIVGLSIVIGGGSDNDKLCPLISLGFIQGCPQIQIVTGQIAFTSLSTMGEAALIDQLDPAGNHIDRHHSAVLRQQYRIESPTYPVPQIAIFTTDLAYYCTL